MSMDRWNPFRDFDNMRQAMDRWMDDRLPNNWLNSGQDSPLSVALDVHETETGYELQASLPGVSPDDIDIQVDRETVTLRGKSASAEEKQEGRNYIYRERRSGAFFRTIRLPEAVDPDKVEATLDHGVLKVQLPKLSQARQRRVQVRSGSNQSSSVQANSNTIAATSSNEGGSPLNVQTGGTNSMSNQQQNQPGSEVSDMKEGTTGYGGEKQGLDANQPDNQSKKDREGALQARGNEATSSSTSGMSDVRAHQSSGQGSGKIGGTPESGETNQYSDEAQKPV